MANKYYYQIQHIPSGTITSLAFSFFEDKKPPMEYKEYSFINKWSTKQLAYLNLIYTICYYNEISLKDPCLKEMVESYSNSQPVSIKEFEFIKVQIK